MPQAQAVSEQTDSILIKEIKEAKSLADIFLENELRRFKNIENEKEKEKKKNFITKAIQDLKKNISNLSEKILEEYSDLSPELKIEINLKKFEDKLFLLYLSIFFQNNQFDSYYKFQESQRDGNLIRKAKNFLTGLDLTLEDFENNFSKLSGFIETLKTRNNTYFTDQKGYFDIEKNMKIAEIFRKTYLSYPEKNANKKFYEFINREVFNNIGQELYENKNQNQNIDIDKYIGKYKELFQHDFFSKEKNVENYIEFSKYASQESSFEPINNEEYLLKNLPDSFRELKQHILKVKNFNEILEILNEANLTGPCYFKKNGDSYKENFQKIKFELLKLIKEDKISDQDFERIKRDLKNYDYVAQNLNYTQLPNFINLIFNNLVDEKKVEDFEIPNDFSHNKQVKFLKGILNHNQIKDKSLEDSNDKKDDSKLEDDISFNQELKDSEKAKMETDKSLKSSDQAANSNSENSSTKEPGNNTNQNRKQEQGRFRLFLGNAERLSKLSESFLKPEKNQSDSSTKNPQKKQASLTNKNFIQEYKNALLASVLILAIDSIIFFKKEELLKFTSDLFKNNNLIKECLITTVILTLFAEILIIYTCHSKLDLKNIEEIKPKVETQI